VAYISLHKKLQIIYGAESQNQLQIFGSGSSMCKFLEISTADLDFAKCKPYLIFDYEILIADTTIFGSTKYRNAHLLQYLKMCAAFRGNL
jgi:hypothetical protein